ncbi:hypothetical protein CO648_21840 [Rhizobium phaseoli]|nr:hypothetical protein CO648_21840 [Rhizobium phaseoli]RUM22346.1 hypothetical protein EFD56_00060 [Rhizobium phaseoli]
MNIIVFRNDQTVGNILFRQHNTIGIIDYIHLTKSWSIKQKILIVDRQTIHLQILSRHQIMVYVFDVKGVLHFATSEVGAVKKVDVGGKLFRRGMAVH